MGNQIQTLRTTRHTQGPPEPTGLASPVSSVPRVNCSIQLELSKLETILETSSAFHFLSLLFLKNKKLVLQSHPPCSLSARREVSFQTCMASRGDVKGSPVHPCGNFVQVLFQCSWHTIDFRMFSGKFCPLKNALFSSSRFLTQISQRSEFSHNISY